MAQQPDQIAYIIFDASSLKLFMPSLYPPIEARAIRELAGEAVARSGGAWRQTVTGFNAAVQPGTFDDHDPRRLPHRGPDADRRRTGRGASRHAPFFAYPVRPGITFTYLATRVNKEARMHA